MAYTINTNIASLQAQAYLRLNGDFQNKTINRVTSGLRIISSGDDAAGLAVANGLRSDEAVLTQGIRNANDGLSTLQTADGGINNISQLLDRARTLATQSASGTFTGDRNVLNGEFQSVLTEIDRQAQAIGLDSGGAFAKSLQVFIGGGRTNNGITSTVNGSVTVDLTKSSVDAKSLGLKGVQATGVSSIDIGTGSANTSVAAILGNTANSGSNAAAGFTDFYFRGAGYADGNRIKVSVNLTGVNDTTTLVTAINNAITAAGNGTSASSTAFKNSTISASVITSSSGTQQLAFSSSTSAFQVSAGDLTSNALLGNVTSSSNPQGLSLTNTVTGGAATAATTTAFGASGAGTITVRFQGASLTSPVDIALTVAAGTTIDQALTSLTSSVAGNASLQAAGITTTTATAGGALVFSNARGEQFNVSTSGDTNGLLGLGSLQGSTGAGGTFDYTTLTSGATAGYAATAESLQISVGGGAGQTISVTPTAATQAATLLALNAAVASNSTLAAAGLKFTAASATTITLASTNSSHFQVAEIGAANTLGFGGAATGVSQVANTASAATASATFDAGGSTQTAVLAFSAIRTGADNQTITISADNTAGVAQNLAVVLANSGSSQNARSIDEAIDTINAKLQQSNNPTLQKVIAVKEQSGGVEGIKFISTLSGFSVAIGTNSSVTGLGDSSTQGKVATTSTSAGGSTADVLSQNSAQNAVAALATAVATLGSAQAVVGRGQNQFTYAVNLAQSQLTNSAAAESRIRDADLASESANLTKAQILLQAGIAALAQANSAPQQVISLLQGR